MPHFLYAFRAPRDYQPGSTDGTNAWNEWFTELGSRVVDVGNPVFTATSAGETGAGTALGGYSLIAADSLEQAAALAHGCPLVRVGGGVEVGEITPLSELNLTTTVADHARRTGIAG